MSRNADNLNIRLENIEQEFKNIKNVQTHILNGLFRANCLQKYLIEKGVIDNDIEEYVKREFERINQSATDADGDVSQASIEEAKLATIEKISDNGDPDTTVVDQSTVQPIEPVITP